MRGTAALAVVCAIAASCDDGELSRSEYVQRANAICTTANAKIVAIPPPDATDAQAVARTVDELVKVQRAEVAKLEAVSPDRDGRDLVREWLEFVRTAIDRTADSGAALRRGDRTAFDAAVQAAAAANADADQRAARLGVTKCTAPPPPAPIGTP